MPASTAVAAGVLDGRAVRRLTRNSAAQRAVTTWRTQLADAWSTAASVAIGLAVLGGWLASVRDQIATRPPVSDTPLPARVTLVVTLVVAVAAVVGLLDRLGPISVSPAAASWWLPLPADRRGLLRGDLARVVGLCALPTALLTAPLAMVWDDEPSLASVGVATLTSAATAAGLAGAVTLLQTRSRGGHLFSTAGAVAVTVSAVAAVAATVPPLARAVGRLASVDVPSIPSSAALGMAAIALVLVMAADRGLGRIRSGSLRTVGATSAHASASVFSMDTRDLGRALAVPPKRAPARPRRFRRVRGPEQAVATADLVLLSRSRWQVGQLVVATAVPVLAVRTEGLDRLPAAGVVGLLLGWLTAAVALGHPARQAQANPALDRLLPLSPGRLIAARCVAPALGLTVVCGCGGLLIGQGTGDVWSWTAIALGAVPAWTAASLRGAYRPELDWSGPVVSSPMGALPGGIGATLVQGVDVGVVGSLPMIVAIVLGGTPSPTLVAVQWAWSGALAAAALTAVARKRSAR
jgi:Family of unknown function (DUF6297)